MKRKSHAQEGLVDFPTDRIESSGEGGMSVYIIAEGEGPRLCFDQRIHLIRQEPLVGDYPEYKPDHQKVNRLAERNLNEWIQDVLHRGRVEPVHIRRRARTGETGPGIEHFRRQAKNHLWHAHYFPGWESLDGDLEFDIVSPDYMAAIQIATTGWSGYEDGYWRCTYEDLSEEGKTLWGILSRRFPIATIRLLTFLDT